MASKPFSSQEETFLITFPNFPILPHELQLKIWLFALPSPRILDVSAIPLHTTLQERLCPSSCSAPEASNWVRTDIERLFASPQPHPPLLHACHTSRSLALQRYPQIPTGSYNHVREERYDLPPQPAPNRLEIVYSLQRPRSRSFALFNPGSDILFLKDPPGWRGEDGDHLISSLEILVRWVGDDVLRGLRRLALPFCTWLRTKRTGSLEVLMRFGALEEVFVTFLGEDEDGGGSWLQGVVDEVGGHVEDVVEDVRRDVEGLARKFPGWKPPRCEVVKHRGCLVKEL